MHQRTFFFHHQLGYRQNPFGALTQEEWTAVSFLPPAIEQWHAAGLTHLQLLGPKGSGKTTTLLKLAAALKAQGQIVVYEYLPDGQHHFTTEPVSGTAFLLDEAQRLRRRERKRWLAWGTAVTLIFSSHTDLSTLFRRARLPLHTHRVDESITLVHYRQWVNRRLAYFALPGQRIELDDSAVAALHHSFGLDMREAEYFLYELFQHPWPKPATDTPWRITAADMASFLPK